MSENMATPFFIASVYYFFKGLEAEKKYANIKFYLLSGALLSVANMFRMVGIVFLIAYLMYTLIYKGIKPSIKMAVPSIIAYALIGCIAFVVMKFEFSIIPGVGFLKFDFSDVIITIGMFIFGAVPGIIIALIRMILSLILVYLE